jgi:hypothetical protein
MSTAAAADALKAADEALAAAKVIRAEAHEQLVVAVLDAGWHVVFRMDDRVVVEDVAGRTMSLEACVAQALAQAAA